jgi:hypothetical protein
MFFIKFLRPAFFRKSLFCFRESEGSEAPHHVLRIGPLGRSYPLPRRAPEAARLRVCQTELLDGLPPFDKGKRSRVKLDVLRWDGFKQSRMGLADGTFRANVLIDFFDLDFFDLGGSWKRSLIRRYRDGWGLERLPAGRQPSPAA